MQMYDLSLVVKVETCAEFFDELCALCTLIEIRGSKGSDLRRWLASGI
jgi:hypothetical protein